jgi:hypothetical protein
MEPTSLIRARRARRFLFVFGKGRAANQNQNAVQWALAGSADKHFGYYSGDPSWKPRELAFSHVFTSALASFL